jgi:hypothetical protein
MKKVHKGFGGETEGRSLGRRRHGSEDNIKTDLQEM